MVKYLFVYGTLIKGERGNLLLSNCVLEDYIHIPGILFDTGKGYPAAKPGNDTDSIIHGELYRLPEKNSLLLNQLDQYEQIGNGIFIREKLNINGSESFMYSLSESITGEKFRPIKSGSWLKFSANIQEDPLSFALNFEKSQRSYYRLISDDRSVYIPGDSGIIVSSPHATNHIRQKKYKIFERYTAAIAVLMHSLTGSDSLYTNSVSMSDPNYFDECKYKKRLEKIFTNRRHIFLLDIHGTGEEKKFDIYPGVGRNMEFLLGRTDILDIFYNKASQHGLSCGDLSTFPASKHQTITKFGAFKHNIPSMQIEINRKYRKPENNPDKFLKIVYFLRDFLGDIKRNE